MPQTKSRLLTLIEYKVATRHITPSLMDHRGHNESQSNGIAWRKEETKRRGGRGEKAAYPRTRFHIKHIVITNKMGVDTNWGSTGCYECLTSGDRKCGNLEWKCVTSRSSSRATRVCSRH